jgi:drug/metabolite transporter (DMT)-like permease
MSPVVLGRLQLLLASLSWSTSGMFAKSPMIAAFPPEWRGPVLAGYRAAFAACILAPVVPWRRFRWRWLMLPMMVAYAGMNVTFLSAMTHTTTAAAIFLQYTCIGWAFLLGLLLLREKATNGDWVSLIFAAVGVGWILFTEWSGAGTKGNLLAIVSGFCYAIVMLCMRAMRDEDGRALVVLCNAAAAVALMPILAGSPVTVTPGQWAIVAAMGVLQLGIPYLLFASAVKHVTAQEASLITLIEAVLNPLWVWMLWGETASIHTWFGGGVILIGLVLRYSVFESSASHKPHEPIPDEPV